MNYDRKWKVAIFQHRLLHYRVDFFNRLRSECASDGIQLELIHGQAAPSERSRKDEAQLEWATPVHNQWIPIGGKELLWQDFPSQHRDSNLFVVMQENRILSNYALLARRALGQIHVAYWGHGANFQSLDRSGIRERWKRWLISGVDWWFAYTEETRRVLLDAGFDDRRVSVLNNAVDTEGFTAELDSITSGDLAAFRSRHAISSTDEIAAFCGSLYLEKRLPEMIAAGDIIAERRPAFKLLVAGAGPATDTIKAATASRPWLVYIGPQYGRDKAMLFKSANLVLNPGLVGLHVLDSFCAGVPMITMADSLHSPEIAYLEHGCNGWISAGGVSSYANDALRILDNASLRLDLSNGALAAGRKYTLASMVNSFLEGLRGCRSVLGGQGG